MKPTNSATISILAMLLIMASGYLKLGVESVIASVAAKTVINITNIILN